MVAFRPWTAAENRRLIKLHKQGMSVNAIATDMRRAPSTISAKGKLAGLPWDRSKTASATEAHKVDAAARRIQLELDLLADAQKLRGRLFTTHTYFEWGGKDHTYDEKTVDQLIPADQLKIMQAIGAAVDRSLKIAQHETGEGVEDAKSLMARMGAALQIENYTPGDDG